MEDAPGASAPRTARSEPNAGQTGGLNGKRGLIDLARVAVDDVIRLVQAEIRLAKTEIREILSSNIKAAILLSVAAVCIMLFLVLGLVTIALLISPHALVSAIEAGVFLIVAIVLGLAGTRLLKIGPPQKTMTSLKEDAQWAKNLLKRNGK